MPKVHRGTIGCRVQDPAAPPTQLIGADLVHPMKEHRDGRASEGAEGQVPEGGGSEAVSPPALPADLREEAGRYAAERRRAGSSVKRVAAELGLSAPTLGIWLQEHHDDQPAIRPVAVATTTPPSSPVLVTPRGFPIEGLGIPEIAELLRSLG